MGAGVYGGSGLSPVVSAHLWKTYAIPRVIYGLEVLSYTLSDLQCLERMQRDMLRKIQSLSKSTASVAVNCLLGVRPVEQELDLRRLTLLCSVLYSDGTLELDIAKRQIAIKDPDSHSWFAVLGFFTSKASPIYTPYSSSLVVKHPVSVRLKLRSIPLLLNHGMLRLRRRPP